MAYIFKKPHVKMIRNLIENNSIGKIYYVRGEFSEYLPDWKIMKTIGVSIWLKNQWVEVQY